MISDLAFGVGVEIVPTIRESDGLAMSSRNAYLDARQRADAPTLYRALTAMRDALERGRSREDANAVARATLTPRAVPDYFDVVSATTFEPLERLEAPAFVIGAAHFGTTRLIDNLYVAPDGKIPA